MRPKSLACLLLVLLPGAARADLAVNTFATGINDLGQAVGYYSYEGHYSHGFLRDASGATRIDVPGAQETNAWGINNLGAIVGTYSTADGANHAFLYNAGSYRTVDVPGASQTNAFGINNLGQIVGSYRASPSGPLIGFIRDGESLVTFSPEAGSAAIFAAGINDAGQVVGSYDASGRSRGYLREGSTNHPFSVGSEHGSTIAYGVNASGAIAGAYWDGVLGTSYHGFIKTGSSVTSFDVPGALKTFALGINTLGHSVGYYFDPVLGCDRGFIRDDAGFSTFSVPFDPGTDDLVTPLAVTPEPSSLAVAAVSVVLVGCYLASSQRIRAASDPRRAH